MSKTIGLIGIFLFFVFYFFLVFTFYKVTKKKGKKISNFSIFKHANALAVVYLMSFVICSEILEKIILFVYGKEKRTEELKVFPDAEKTVNKLGIVLRAEITMHVPQERGLKCIVCREKKANQIAIVPAQPFRIAFLDELKERRGEATLYAYDFLGFNKCGCFCSQECRASYTLWLFQHNLPKNRLQKILWPLILHYYRSRRRAENFLIGVIFN